MVVPTFQVIGTAGDCRLEPLRQGDALRFQFVDFGQERPPLLNFR